MTKNNFHTLKKQIETFYKKQKNLELPSGHIVEFRNQGCFHLMFKGNKNKRDIREIESRFMLFQNLNSLFDEFLVSPYFRIIQDNIGQFSYMFYELEWQDYRLDSGIHKIRVIFRKKLESQNYQFYSIFGKRINPHKEEL